LGAVFIPAGQHTQKRPNGAIGCCSAVWFRRLAHRVRPASLCASTLLVAWIPLAACGENNVASTAPLGLQSRAANPGQGGEESWRCFGGVGSVVAGAVRVAALAARALGARRVAALAGARLTTTGLGFFDLVHGFDHTPV